MGSEVDGGQVSSLGTEADWGVLHHKPVCLWGTGRWLSASSQACAKDIRDGVVGGELASPLCMPEGNQPLSPRKTENLGRWKGIGSALPLLKFFTARVL